MGIFCPFGYIIPFFRRILFLNLEKTQIPRTVYVKHIPISISICLATIGVCVFRCAGFGWRTFLFSPIEKKDRRKKK